MIKTNPPTKAGSSIDGPNTRDKQHCPPAYSYLSCPENLEFITSNQIDLARSAFPILLYHPYSIHKVSFLQRRTY